MEKKERNENRERKFPNSGVTNKVKSVARSHSALPQETKQSSPNTSKLSELSVNISDATEPKAGGKNKKQSQVKGMKYYSGIFLYTATK